MAGILLLALAASMVFDKQISKSLKILMLTITLAGSSLMVPFALDYAGVGENVDAESLQSYINKRQGYNREGGSSLDISSMSLPFQMFTYLVRPLPFEAHSITALVSSFDNVFILFLFIYSFIKRKKNYVGKENRSFMWIYVTSSLIILSMTTANLGIAPTVITLFVNNSTLLKKEKTLVI